MVRSLLVAVKGDFSLSGVLLFQHQNLAVLNFAFLLFFSYCFLVDKCIKVRTEKAECAQQPLLWGGAVQVWEERGFYFPFMLFSCFILKVWLAIPISPFQRAKEKDTEENWIGAIEKYHNR